MEGGTHHTNSLTVGITFDLRTGLNYETFENYCFIIGGSAKLMEEF